MKAPTKINICRHTPLCRADLKEECGNFYYGKCDYDDGPCSVNTYLLLSDNEVEKLRAENKDLKAGIDNALQILSMGHTNREREAFAALKKILKGQEL